MRDLRHFARLEDYRAFVDAEIFVEPLIREHPFYRRLIDFVLCERTPLFYDISDRSEHFGFSATYHFQTIREYPDAGHQSLFFLHDFTHLLFEYPHDVRAWSAEAFERMFTYQERLASNESEVLVHFREPRLRPAVLPGVRMWADVLRERGAARPDPMTLYAVRDRLVMDDAFGDVVLSDEPEVLAWLRSWRTLTPKWCRARHARLREVAAPRYPWRRLTGATYEAEVAAYRPEWSQARYEEHTLRNLALAYALLGWEDPPSRFGQARDAVARLEGQVLL